MRALWLIRADLQCSPGGDTTQILETAAALRRHGVTIEMSSAPNPDFRHFDIVHLFHLDRVWENVGWCHLIRASGIPSALSPIYWPSEEFDRNGRIGMRGALTRLTGTKAYHELKLLHRAALPLFERGDPRTLKNAVLGHRFAQRYVLDTVSVLLPNSGTERSLLQNRFGADRRLFVVRNAVNSETFSARSPQPSQGSTLSSRADRRDDTVLCVGRIEPRKNQLMLIRALKDTPLRLRIIGRAGEFHRSYERRCRREAGPNVEFLSWRAPHELRPWYRASRAHVAPSWYETPGLASLEAAYCGCPIVTTAGGSTREYFGEQAEYCSPGDPLSIRNAVERAVSRPAPPRLALKIGARFTWEAAAKETLAAYDCAVKLAVNGRRPELHLNCLPAGTDVTPQATPAESDVLEPSEQRAS